MDMEKITRLIRSLNETHRICTHDISGHLHLLRFCIDEYAEQLKEENPLIQKIDEAIGKLEDMNKEWKISTRFHDPKLETSSESILEKAFGVIRLYYGKFIPNIEYDHDANEAIDFEKGTIIVELVFAFCSVICQYAVVNEIKSLNFFIGIHKSDKNRLELIIKNPIVLEKEFVLNLLSKGDENDRTLRRLTALDCLSQFDGYYKIEEDKTGYSVRVAI